MGDVIRLFPAAEAPPLPDAPPRFLVRPTPVYMPDPVIEAELASLGRRMLCIEILGVAALVSLVFGGFAFLIAGGRL